jgi:hypothetical protein
MASRTHIAEREVAFSDLSAFSKAGRNPCKGRDHLSSSACLDFCTRLDPKLILSSVDLLGDLSTLEKPLRVMADGLWRSSAELQRLLGNVAAKYEAAQIDDEGSRIRAAKYSQN